MLADLRDNKKKVRKDRQKERGSNTITFQYDNHKLVYDATSDKFYVTFDVMVSSNNSAIYFSQTVLKIQYNNTPYLYCQGGGNGTFMTINTQPSHLSWNYKISGTLFGDSVSFYQAFMHELGHVLLLNHVNKSSDLMYYSITSNAPIIQVTSTDTVVLAVKENISASQSSTIKWHLANPSYPGLILYPPGVLKTSFAVTNACYGTNTGSIITSVTGGDHL